jgi:hypothetical protein
LEAGAPVREGEGDADHSAPGAQKLTAAIKPVLVLESSVEKKTVSALEVDVHDPSEVPLNDASSGELVEGPS